MLEQAPSMFDPFHSRMCVQRSSSPSTPARPGMVLMNEHVFLITQLWIFHANTRAPLIYDGWYRVSWELSESEFSIVTTINLRSLQYFCIVVRLQSDNFGSVHSETQQFLMFHHGSLHFSDGLPLSVELIAHATPARSSRWNRTEFLISRSASGSRRESSLENAKNSSRPTNRRSSRKRNSNYIIALISRVPEQCPAAPVLEYTSCIASRNWDAADCRVLERCWLCPGRPTFPRDSPPSFRWWYIHISGCPEKGWGSRIIPPPLLVWFFSCIVVGHP